MIEYLTLDELLEIHSHMIAKFGGLRGIRNKTLLQSSIEMPKSTMFKEDLYPTIYDKAAVYLFCIIKNHPFNDANKRTGCAAAYTQVNSKVGNLAKPAPQIWDNEVALKQLNLNKLSDAGGPKDEDVRRSRKPTFEFICVYLFLQANNIPIRFSDEDYEDLAVNIANGQISKEGVIWFLEHGNFFIGSLYRT